MRKFIYTVTVGIYGNEYSESYGIIIYADNEDEAYEKLKEKVYSNWKYSKPIDFWEYRPIEREG